MIIGLVIAAGKQSRFQQQKPKCLSLINNKCILDTTIENMSHICDEVLVVCSKECESYFINYKHISIESGLGSGDAIYKAINYIIDNYNITSNDYVIIQWGDALVNKELYSVLEFLPDRCAIPCTIEESPYVQLVEFEDTISVKFSKYNDVITPGYHDMCVFSSNISYLANYLAQFFIKYFSVDHYNHRHGNEFEFLDVFNDTDCKAKIIYVDSSLSTKSFNTVKELESLGGTVDGK